MRLSSTLTAYVVEGSGSRLFCSKIDGKITVDNFVSAEIPVGETEFEIVSILGRLDIEDGSFLMVVTETSVVGEFIEQTRKFPIHRIDRVQALPLATDACYKLSSSRDSKDTVKLGRSKQNNFLKFMQAKLGKTNSLLLDEILRLFNDDPGFYFCFERDITHSTQRYFSNYSGPDDRFFWNKMLLKDLLNSELNLEQAKQWITPVIQGHISSYSLPVSNNPLDTTLLHLTLISRRSVYRAGARYLRRGIDHESNVANFVETELLLNVFGHHLSFVQVRGSVPIFWSQKGFKYRPPLSIDKTLDDSLPYFTKHMSSLLNHYGVPLVAVSLVDQAGREFKLAQSYLEHSIKFDSPDLNFVSFDLHRHCRGLKFDKVYNLLSNLECLLAEIGYCWVDKTGEVVKQQQGILRTNCVDCLDRTNVVQGAISQYVCMQQAQRLGIFGPLSDPPVSLITMLQNMWADNGDAISTQYAGTAALKGDVTRNGERRLAGIMKDGYNSASRYYLSHMRDSARQKAINALLGQPDKGSETMYTSDSDSDEDESVSRLVAETAHFLLPDMEVIVGGWGLSHLQESKDTVNCVVLLTRTKLHIAEYDGDADNLIDVKTEPLENIKTIEVGRPSRSSRLHIRIVSLHSVHLWTAARTRLFNNVAIRLKTSEEADEYIESIADQIRVAINMSIGKNLRVERPARIQQIGHGSARKALASVAYAFKSISRGRTHAPASDCSGTTMSSEDCPPSFKRETTGIHLFHDDMDMYTSNSSPPKLPMSSSDGRLSDRSPVLSNLLKGLRTIAMSEDSTPHPFQALVNLMEHTKTKLILL